MYNTISVTAAVELLAASLNTHKMRNDLVWNELVYILLIVSV